MALITCDECGANVSDKAAACPKCGNPIRHAVSGALPAKAQKSKSPIKRTLGGTLLGLFIAGIAVVAFAEWLSGNTKPTNGPSASQASDAIVSDAASAAAAAAAEVASAASAAAADRKCAADLQCVADKNNIAANAQCEVMIEDRAREIAKWDYKVGGEHWYTPFTSKISWSGTTHQRIVYYGDEAKFQNGFGAWQRQSYWCVFDIASQKVVDAKFDAEGTPPLEDDAGSNSQPPAPTTTADTNANDAVAGMPAGNTQSGSSAPTTFNTSFDCAKARSDSEHLICGDAELAADDVELAGLYAKAKAVATDQAAFKEHVRQQWNYRESTCHDRDCLAQWYVDQKQWFTNIVSGQAGSVNQPQAGQPPSVPTYQTSFNCSAPTFLDEQAICHDPGLAAMDRELAAQYDAAAKRAADPAKLQADQNGWVASRRDCAGDLNCLRRAYGVRIGQLQQQS